MPQILESAPTNELTVQTELARWPPKIIVVDWNNTVTDPKFNDQILLEHIPVLQEAITEAQKKDWVVIVSSDSPFGDNGRRPLLEKAKALGFNSFGILENGCVLYNSETDTLIVRASIPNIANLKIELDDRLKGVEIDNRGVYKLHNPFWSPEWGIPNDFTIKDGQALRQGIPGDLVYAYGAGRIATGTIFSGELIDERGVLKFTPVPRLTEIIDAELADFKMPGIFPAGCTFYSYPTDGFTAVHPGGDKKDVGRNKGRANALLLNGFPSRIVCSIGDDWRDGKNLAELTPNSGRWRCAAVGNASDELKSQADFVASQPLALGVAEAIRHFIES